MNIQIFIWINIILIMLPLLNFFVYFKLPLLIPKLVFNALVIMVVGFSHNN